MSVQNENAVSGGETLVRERSMDNGVYASLFEKINLTPATGLSDLSIWQDEAAMAEADANERITAGVKVFLERLRQSGQKVDKLDKTLIDHHIAELDYQISRQLDVVMHHVEFQKVESLWRGLKHLVDNTDYRQNVKTEILDISKDDLRQDFEDAPEIIQSGLYTHTYVAEYDTPGGEPIAAVISAYEFDASAQDVALMRNISKVSAAAHMPFIGSAGPKFFNKTSMEDVAAIKDIGNYFDRAEYIKWKSFRDTDDSRYLGLVMPRVLGRLPYGPDITAMHTHARRDEDFGVNFEGIPDSPDFGFRPEPGQRPVMAGTLPARVTSTKENDTYPTTDFYRTGDDRFIFLHGGYPKLRDGILDILNVPNNHKRIAGAVAGWNAEYLEATLADAGLYTH